MFDMSALKFDDRGLIPAEKLIFTHHGVEILADFDGELKKAQAVMPGRVVFVNDADRMELAPAGA